MDTLKDQHLFVTGGGSGIGLGFCRVAAGLGARVTVADIREDHLDETRAIAEREGWLDRAGFTRLDISDRSGFGVALDQAIERLGPLRVIVNNAGVGVNGPMPEAVYADWDWGISVNLNGVVNGVVEGLARIRAHGQGGHILNTASMGAFFPARPGRGIYAATKAAVVTLSEHLKLELEGQGIGVSILCPGPVKTNIRESGRTRHDRFRDGSKFVALEQQAEKSVDQPQWLDPLDVGRMMVQAILKNELYIFTHPEFLPNIRTRHAAIEHAIVNGGPVDL